ncbi:MAG: hypothetical protein M0Z47_01055 [Actinomycetota bacterium]|nr:hypothetical protein [Actinomycetota bacterium]
MRPERLSKAQAVRLGDALGAGGSAARRFEAIAEALAEAGFDDIAAPGVPGELATGYQTWRQSGRPPGDERLVEAMEELAAWLIEMRRLP